MNLTELKKKIEKNFGENTAIEAESVKYKKPRLIPVGPYLDIGLNGGVPAGSWMLISGPAKAGKTSLAMQIVKNAQQLYGAQTIVLNAEGRFKGQTIRSIDGIDLSKMLIVESTEERLLSAEDFLTVAEDAIKEINNPIIVIDSVSRLYTAAAQDKDVSGTKRPTTPKLVSDFVSRMSGIVPSRGAIVICIAQSYANISGYGKAILRSAPNS